MMFRQELGRQAHKIALPAAIMLGGVALWQHSKIAALEQANEKLRYEATHDKLTGLLNRSGLEEALTRSRQPVALLYIDGTNQKAVNDILGHDRGDAAIRGTAEVIKESLREQDIAARIGGDEFLVILNPEAHDGPVTRPPEDLLQAVTSRMAANTKLYLQANPDLADQAGFNIAVGGAIWQEGMSVEDLRQVAEAHMYTVKGQQHEDGGQYR